MSSPSLIPMFSGDGQRVFVTDNNGTPGSIPVENLGDALQSKNYTLGVSPVHYDSLLKSGAKIGVHVTSPDGKDGILPSDQVGEAIKPENGFKLGPSYQQNIPLAADEMPGPSAQQQQSILDANAARPWWK